MVSHDTAKETAFILTIAMSMDKFMAKETKSKWNLMAFKEFAKVVYGDSYLVRKFRISLKFGS